VARAMGIEVILGPYQDGRVEVNDGSRRYLAEIIRTVKPTHVITHWKNSFHKDHEAAFRITSDAVLMAALPGVQSESPPHRGIRGIYYTENWEDETLFSPYLIIQISQEDMEKWREAVARYEFVSGGISGFRYLDYYEALARVRGLRNGHEFAVAFDVDEYTKRRPLNELP